MDFLQGNYSESILLRPTDTNKIINIIKDLKNTSPGWDNISPSVIKDSVHIIVGPLVHIINLSLSSGTFPKELKIAKVLPLFKSGDASFFNNYRPVSVLPVVSKVFNKIYFAHLINFLKKQNILYKYQFGFRKQHSTFMALMILVDQISNAFERGEYVMGVFLDFSKAFDTIDHNILLQKLNYYGIRGVANVWLESYVSNRLQFVNYQRSNSSECHIKCGVPQGSMLVPLLFLIYVMI
jgi:hypothetical protein